MKRIKRSSNLKDDAAYYSCRLHDPWLLDLAVPIIANRTAFGLAVPAGGHRKFGSIEMFGIRDADIPGVRSLLLGKLGFENLRFRRFPSNRAVQPDYYEARWGNAGLVKNALPPFPNGWDGDGKSPLARASFMRRQGRIYGYSVQAIEDKIRENEADMS